MQPSPSTKTHQPLGPTVSGEVGLVVTLTAESERLCRAAAAEFLPGNSEYVLGAQNLPHLTLYQAALKDCDTNHALELAADLSGIISGKELFLRDLVVFGGKFLFWNVNLHGSGVQELRDCHERSLVLARYLDLEENARLLPSRPGTEQQIENFAHYGYGLLRELYLPHVTLGVNSGFEASRQEFPERLGSVVASAVAVTRMGQFGKVVEVLTT